MTDPSPDVKSVSGIFGFISERGVISGLYIASICFGLILGTEQFTIATQLHVWIASACILTGLIVSNITFEVLITPCRWLTSRITLKRFNKTLIKEGKGVIHTYDQLRQWREDYLASDHSQHYKARIEKDERLRNTVSYLATSSILALAMLITATYKFPVKRFVLEVEYIVVSYVLITSWLGMITRSANMGRTIALAYLHQTASSKTKVAMKK